ncbi:hypothetical protein PPTG_20733 [Phytophthora nicotianae INRA-310]|uniref:Uncharacterized protein n=1 Tax=Phytophthora nicotianae (strain INRA-310) TaxID=761204 RepID=W2RH97_PHYN3|nr:hypothetical protein PPTG_20733 [Phytophthora nicotianae INRA-310]ETN23945.1 hypothetical protein PPTG_20733 [Phytophthora nicotianae INRA-310]
MTVFERFNIEVVEGLLVIGMTVFWHRSGGWVR